MLDIITITFFSILAAGFVVGVVVGLTGMGGGALMTPMLVLLFGIQQARSRLQLRCFPGGNPQQLRQVRGHPRGHAFRRQRHEPARGGRLRGAVTGDRRQITVGQPHRALEFARSIR